MPAQPPGATARRRPRPKAKGKGEAKKKGEPGPKGDLRKAYDLLRRLRAADGRPRAVPRSGSATGPSARRSITATASKALMRATASSPASTGPSPTTWPGPSTMPATPRSSTAATPTCRRPPTASAPKTPANEPAATCTAPTTGFEFSDGDPRPEAGFYLKAARDLYNAARRDVEAGRDERAGELARAAEAMTHVPEHLGHAADGRPGGPGARGGFDPPPPEPKKKDGPPGVFDPPPDPKGERSETRDRGLPPPLP